MKNIKIGTIVPSDYQSNQTLFPKLAEYGFESIELNFNNKFTPAQMTEYAKKASALAEQYNLEISALSLYGNPLDNTGEYANTIETLEMLIDNACVFGTSIVASFAGRVIDRPVEESIPRFAQVFTPLAKRAKEKGVRIAFENCNMGGDWQKGGWNIAFNPKIWEMMFHAVPEDNIGLEWEPTHQMCQLIDPIAQLKKWAKTGRIFHVHGKDCTLDWDAIRQYGIASNEPFAWHRTPGFGDCNWTDIISILRMNHFEGNIDIEGYHDPIYNGEWEFTGQVHGLRYLKECRGGDFIDFKMK